MTLQELKVILDKGNCITNGKEKIRKGTGGDCYYYEGIHNLPAPMPWAFFEGYIGTPSDWYEAKPGATNPSDEMIRKMIFAPRERKPKPPQFAPRMMVIDAREWEAIQKELEELREVNLKLIQQLKEK